VALKKSELYASPVVPVSCKTVFPVRGVFAGNTVDGVLTVAVVDISRHEAEVAVRSTSIGHGLFIGDDFMPEFVRC